jgi:hypothetical protein
VNPDLKDRHFASAKLAEMAMIDIEIMTPLSDAWALAVGVEISPMGFSSGLCQTAKRDSAPPRSYVVRQSPNPIVAAKAPNPSRANRSRRPIHR